jgi:hypothetical protein
MAESLYKDKTVNKTSNIKPFEWGVAEKNRLVERQDFVHIAVLVIITLVIGVYLIATTVLISKDGTLYIACARKTVDIGVQAPGYPFSIYLMHKAAGVFYDTQSLQGWIISAQAVSLLSKLIAVIALYFVGSYFVGSRLSFWGVLILSILPDSVSYGSDALTDWPNIMFLATGFLLLLSGVRYRKPWIFGCAGIAGGFGYLVRPECGQVVLYGIAWLLFNIIRPQDKMKRTKAAGALLLLLAGFGIIAVPYMQSKGYVFPEQPIWKLPALLSMSYDNIGSALNTNMYLAGLSIGKIIGNNTLVNNMCETLLYYFVPALLTGSYYYFRRQPKKVEQTFFAAAFIVVNVAIALWQSSYRGLALSRRYTLPLVAFTIFYIPVGFHIIACWLGTKGVAVEKNVRRWFFILIVIGIGICATKLVMITPLRWEKQGYRDAAEWLSKNTDPTDIVAVPDMRIIFYAERKGIEYSEQLPEQANYIVRIAKSNDEKLGIDKNIKEEYSTWVNSHKKSKLVIYKVIR